MLDTQAPERRRAPRHRRRFLVHDRTGTSQSARPSIDLWQNGMRLVVQREHGAGALIELDVYLGDRPEPLRLHGEVVTVRAGEALVRFEPSAGDRDRLTGALSLSR